MNGSCCWTLAAPQPKPSMELSPTTTACLPLAQMSRPCSPPSSPRQPDSQGMEQHEYMDRARQYSTRLAVLSSSLTHWKKLPPLPSLTSQPHQVLASEPIPFSDLQQVSRIAAYAYSALSQIRVDAKEELVVQFGIP
ncbi:PREDICTED: ragulator complex protein LAMTOR1 isoform X2 [Propithecus coquereli]|uniref:ragulator complex protein LAMTOR1 isoform X2 n=1 Tax=Propithecus coquereli TaxID=379532 RepID=UPI00063F7342|nr:PREDICTED: ragulator complex protein LAMTOR1 isoform X2 [Propithecus coquereli]